MAAGQRTRLEKRALQSITEWNTMEQSETESLCTNGREATHSVSAVHRLLVDGGIPVRVVEDDRVCSSEVDTEATSSRREEKDEHVVPVLEVRHHVTSIGHLGRSVETHVCELSPCHVPVLRVCVCVCVCVCVRVCVCVCVCVHVCARMRVRVVSKGTVHNSSIGRAPLTLQEGPASVSSASRLKHDVPLSSTR
jgi:hypothetical protein